MEIELLCFGTTTQTAPLQKINFLNKLPRNLARHLKINKVQQDIFAAYLFQMHLVTCFISYYHYQSEL